MTGADRPEHEDDIDAEFAALVGDLEVDVPDLGPARAQAGGIADGTADGREGAHDAEGDAEGDVAGALSEVTVPDDAAALAADDVTGVGKAVTIAVVLTPLASADALAALCAMSGLECTVVLTSTGAMAVKEFVSAHAQWDVAELLGGAETEPAQAAELAGALSRLSRAGVVLMTAELATDVGIESGLSGTITARSYAGGQAGQDMSAGLVLAGADQVVEDVLLGVVRAEDAPGAVRTDEVRPSRLMRWFGRGARGAAGTDPASGPGTTPDEGGAPPAR